MRIAWRLCWNQVTERRVLIGRIFAAEKRKRHVTMCDGRSSTDVSFYNRIEFKANTLKLKGDKSIAKMKNCNVSDERYGVFILFSFVRRTTDYGNVVW